jgi:uncharacterized metal-binding protein YceD (DUF177 family)
VNDSFFNEFEYSPIKKGNVLVSLVQNKKDSEVFLKFEYKGSLKLQCDICLNEFDYNVAFENEIVLKRTTEPGKYTSNFEIKYISNNQSEYSIAADIYESLITAIPMKKKCPDGKCDKDMMALMNTYEKKKDDIDPRWIKLLKLKK